MKIIKKGEYDNLTWTLYNNGTLKIKGKGEIARENAENIPLICDRYPWNANKSDITRVVIDEGITSIGDCAFFRCENLAEVMLPDSMASIGYQAFSCCEKLSEVTIPNSVTSIAWHAFHNTGVTTITIPNTIRHLEFGAFSGCKKLVSAKSPNGVANKKVFYGRPLVKIL